MNWLCVVALSTSIVIEPAESLGFLALFVAWGVFTLYGLRNSRTRLHAIFLVAHASTTVILGVLFVIATFTRIVSLVALSLGIMSVIMGLSWPTWVYWREAIPEDANHPRLYRLLRLGVSISGTLGFFFYGAHFTTLAFGLRASAH